MCATTPRMPVLFIGHGSPMNAIEDNDYTRAISKLARDFPSPTAVLCISAHWLTQGSWVTHMAWPKTIHDFGGFPKELFAVQYPAPGSPKLAELVQRLVTTPALGLDDQEWGLDHGAWSVLRHLYPQADIPVLQLSIDFNQPGSYHYAL